LLKRGLALVIAHLDERALTTTLLTILMAPREKPVRSAIIIMENDAAELLRKALHLPEAAPAALADSL
jgi:hypothetical protein